ncbi:hypothetical protein LdCL_140009800 [Leishmania donovani]|uniref:Uncharacterized protein n=1 Tax=Leishmania donovani TaxID=5661 RepID=A0A3Q8IBY4_LEIDO|nr:hypothetical protein LdCL_140009800 [Leishmania donovani]
MLFVFSLDQQVTTHVAGPVLLLCVSFYADLAAHDGATLRCDGSVILTLGGGPACCCVDNTSHVDANECISEGGKRTCTSSPAVTVRRRPRIVKEDGTAAVAADRERYADPGSASAYGPPLLLEYVALRYVRTVRAALQAPVPSYPLCTLHVAPPQLVDVSATVPHPYTRFFQLQ